MKSRSIDDGVERTFVLILDHGEGAFKAVSGFFEPERLPALRCRAISAF